MNRMDRSGMARRVHNPSGGCDSSEPVIHGQTVLTLRGREPFRVATVEVLLCDLGIPDVQSIDVFGRSCRARPSDELRQFFELAGKEVASRRFPSTVGQRLMVDRFGQCGGLTVRWDDRQFGG